MTHSTRRNQCSIRLKSMCTTLQQQADVWLPRNLFLNLWAFTYCTQLPTVSLYKKFLKKKVFWKILFIKNLKNNGIKETWKNIFKYIIKKWNLPK